MMVALVTKAERFSSQDNNAQLSELDSDLLTESEEQDRKTLLNLLRMSIILREIPKRRSFNKREKTYVRLINKKGGYYNRPCLVNVMSCYFFGLN